MAEKFDVAFWGEQLAFHSEALPVLERMLAMKEEIDEGVREKMRELDPDGPSIEESIADLKQQIAQTKGLIAYATRVRDGRVAGKTDEELLDEFLKLSKEESDGDL